MGYTLSVGVCLTDFRGFPKAQMQSGQLSKSLEALFYVYSQLDASGILEAQFPNSDTFFEGEIKNINYSFLKFLDAHPQLEDSEKTSLGEKFQSESYESVYEVFHDLKLACITKILEYEDNPTLYAKTDQFYKISVEMLLREAIRLGAALKKTESPAEAEAEEEVKEEAGGGAKSTEGTDTEQSNDSKIQTQLSQLKPIESTDSLGAMLEKDFDIITSTFYTSTGKALSIFASGNVPFFSSLNSLKSDLDDREPIIDPALGITLTNVIPNVSFPTDEKLSKFTNPDAKIPNIRQILENYMHPNWLRLISSQWLKHGDGLSSLNFSFAPTYDETQSIISNDWKGLTWCQQIGFKKLVDAKSRYDDLLALQQASEKKETKLEEDTKVEKSVEPEDSNMEKITKDEEVTTANDDVDISDDESKTEKEENGEKDDSSDSIDHDPDSREKIDLANVLLWDANKVVAEDEVKAVKENKVQATVSDLLNDLSQLRQDRIDRQKKHARYNKNILGTGSRIFKPSNEELKLYFKIKRLLTGLIEAKDINPNQIDIEIDKRLPVLQHTYQGTLPASFGVSNQKTSKSKRKR